MVVASGRRDQPKLALQTDVSCLWWVGVSFHSSVLVMQKVPGSCNAEDPRFHSYHLQVGLRKDPCLNCGEPGQIDGLTKMMIIEL